MEIEILRKFEGELCRLILKNSFTYSAVYFCITSDNLIQFEDRYGELISVQPEFIVAVSKIKTGGRE